MIEYTAIFANGLPALVTGVVTYVIARKKNKSDESIKKSKIDVEVQIKALDIVKGVIQDMRDEFIREIQDLKLQIKSLTEENHKLKNSIKELDAQLTSNNKLNETLRSETSSLKDMLKSYKDENEKLKIK